MLNAASQPELPRPIHYEDASVARGMAAGGMNTTDEQVLANIKSAIRRGHPQMRTGKNRSERICLVGSGPSLNSSLDELRQLIWEGAILVTMNGAYHWCIEHNLRPQTQIVMDARPSNARFLQPEVPKCNYVLASQCAPEAWDAVEGRPHVFIFHALVKSGEEAATVLDACYVGNWIGIGGGVTVASRAIYLLRTMGYLKFDLFGIDCCWTGDTHHAMPQPENQRDTRFLVTVGERGRVESDRTFRVSPWHLKQYEDFLTLLAMNGHYFALTSHGDGMLTHALSILGADSPLSMSLSEEGVSNGSSSVQTL